MEPEKEVAQCYEQMNIVEKYETVIAYLYPIAQNIPRKHGVAKAMFIECLLEQVKLIVEAGKSGQISRLFVKSCRKRAVAKMAIRVESDIAVTTQ